MSAHTMIRGNEETFIKGRGELRLIYTDSGSLIQLEVATDKISY